LTKSKGGRPQYQPTDDNRKMVEAMVAYGVPLEEISDVLEIDRKTLSKHFDREIKTAAARANSRVAESLYKKAIGDGQASVTAAIFWLKTKAGWKEVDRVEHTGADGGPIKVTREDARRHIEGLFNTESESKPNGSDKLVH